MARKLASQVRSARSPRSVVKSRGELRTLEVLRAATALFLQKGYQSVSVEEIIAVAGGSTTHIYRQFGGKRGLFIAVVSDLCDKVQIELDSVDTTGLSLIDGLRTFAYGFTDAMFDPQHQLFNRLIFSEAARFPEAAEIWYVRGPQASARIVGRFLEGWMVKKKLRITDPMTAGFLFCNMIAGSSFHRTWMTLGKKGSATEARAMADATIDLFLNGYLLRD